MAKQPDIKETLAKVIVTDEFKSLLETTLSEHNPYWWGCNIIIGKTGKPFRYRINEGEEPKSHHVAIVKIKYSGIPGKRNEIVKWY